MTLTAVGAFIDENAKCDVRCSAPKIPIEHRDVDGVEAVQPEITEGALMDVVRQNPLAVIVGWRLCELARAGDVTASNVEPVALNPPVKNLRHSVGLPELLLGSVPRCGP